jgi:uncharacterized damage-inducible protein DinB
MRGRELEQYASGPDQLEAALAGLAESELDAARGQGRWTIRQIVHHIVDGDDIWKVCIKAALGSPCEAFSLAWYRSKTQVEWAESWAYSRREVGPSLAQFRASRQHIVQLVKEIPQAMERSIVVRWSNDHEARMTVGEVIEMQARHVAHHVQQILETRGRTDTGLSCC